MIAKAPRVGDLAPDFTLPNTFGAPVHLKSLLEKRAVVLFFYPKDDTAGCTVEACTFRDYYREFKNAGAEVVGVSRDDQRSHERFATGHRLPFLLLSDPDSQVHALYGVRRLLLGLVSDRTTFVIDRASVIRHVFTSRLRFAQHANTALSVVRSLSS